MSATNHAGHAVYILTNDEGWVIVGVRPTRAEALELMATLPASGEYTVREAVLHKGKIV